MNTEISAVEVREERGAPQEMLELMALSMSEAESRLRQAAQREVLKRISPRNIRFLSTSTVRISAH